MTTLPLNGVRPRGRLVEVKLNRLKLHPENPRLHSAYLTHDLPARPNEKQIAAVLEQLPEFQALLDAITRNDGVFQPPLVSADFRVLEGNRASRRCASCKRRMRKTSGGARSPYINWAYALRRNRSALCGQSSIWKMRCRGMRCRN